MATYMLTEPYIAMAIPMPMPTVVVGQPHAYRESTDKRSANYYVQSLPLYYPSTPIYPEPSPVIQETIMYEYVDFASSDPAPVYSSETPDMVVLEPVPYIPSPTPSPPHRPFMPDCQPAYSICSSAMSNPFLYTTSSPTSQHYDNQVEIDLTQDYYDDAPLTPTSDDSYCWDLSYDESPLPSSDHVVWGPEQPSLFPPEQATAPEDVSWMDQLSSSPEEQQLKIKLPPSPEQELTSPKHMPLSTQQSLTSAVRAPLTPESLTSADHSPKHRQSCCSEHSSCSSGHALPSPRDHYNQPIKVEKVQFTRKPKAKIRSPKPKIESPKQKIRTFRRPPINPKAHLFHLDTKEIENFLLKPRRTQVKVACLHCKNSCKKCAEERPCPRCIKQGTADTCFNAPQSKPSKVAKTHPTPLPSTVVNTANANNKSKKSHSYSTPSRTPALMMTVR
ncbi:hypothetical protein HK102_009143 [Quaeritorhiza haematococci]|nr:hypothetical protein HK102_009143 [Quaeritorhiza haematococci]